MNNDIVLSVGRKNLQQIVLRVYTVVYNQSIWTYVSKNKLKFAFKDHYVTVGKSS